MTHPEFPYLAAGAVAVIGGARKAHGWPPSATKALLGTVALVLVASATGQTRFAPLVHAIGLLLLMASIMAAVRTNIEQKAGKQ